MRNIRGIKLLSLFLLVFIKQEATESEVVQYNKRLDTLFSTVSEVSIEDLCRLWPEKFVFYVPSNVADILTRDLLMKLFRDHNLVPCGLFPRPREWSEQNWDQAVEILKNRAILWQKLWENPRQNNEAIINTNIVRVKGAQRLLADAKTIAKSLVIGEEIEDLVKRGYFIKQGGLDRIFTYIKIAKAIKDMKLRHVRLPLKFLAIKQSETNSYITNKEEATVILKNIIKAFVGPSTSLNFFISDYSENKYQLLVFAQKIQDGSTKLSKEAREDLEKLIKAAPFDIGQDNIFSDDEGNAIIIDTEYKGESAALSLEKFAERY